MTDRELFAATRDAYLSFIHLQDAVDESLSKISMYSAKVSDSLIDQLLRDGDSWRERLLGLVLGAMRGLDQFYESLVISLHKTGGISIVPISAALAVAVRDCGCRYDLTKTASLDRDRWDGEVGFAIDWLHYSINMGDAPLQSVGPNYGQNFCNHLDFYTKINGTLAEP